MDFKPGTVHWTHGNDPHEAEVVVDGRWVHVRYPQTGGVQSFNADLVRSVSWSTTTEEEPVIDIIGIA